MPVAPYLIAAYGPEESPPPQGGFASSEEQTVYYALVRRIGRAAFLYNVQFGDIPFTPGREQRSAEFVIPALDSVILVNSAFTHPSADADQLAQQMLESLGYRVYWLWDYEIVSEMGGDVEAALDRIPGLVFFGTFGRESSDRRRKRTYKQPPRNVTFRGIGARRWG